MDRVDHLVGCVLQLLLNHPNLVMHCTLEAERGCDMSLELSSLDSVY